MTLCSRNISDSSQCWQKVKILINYILCVDPFKFDTELREFYESAKRGEINQRILEHCILSPNKSQIEKRIAIEFIINEEFLLGCLVDSNKYGEVYDRLLTHGSQKAVVRRIRNKEMLRDIIFGDFTRRVKRVAIRKINDESIIQKAF